MIFIFSIGLNLAIKNTWENSYKPKMAARMNSFEDMEIIPSRPVSDDEDDEQSLVPEWEKRKWLYKRRYLGKLKRNSFYLKGRRFQEKNLLDWFRWWAICLHWEWESTENGCRWAHCGRWNDRIR